VLIEHQPDSACEFFHDSTSFHEAVLH